MKKFIQMLSLPLMIISITLTYSSDKPTDASTPTSYEDNASNFYIDPSSPTPYPSPESERNNKTPVVLKQDEEDKSHCQCCGH